MWFCVWAKLCDLRILWFHVAGWFKVGHFSSSKIRSRMKSVSARRIFVLSSSSSLVTALWWRDFICACMAPEDLCIVSRVLNVVVVMPIYEFSSCSQSPV